ncbi:MAG: hypothetical protein IKF82_00565 [Bacilli bacterium]|nr:hypothetical protein [Bacilli bacterium]
MDISLRDKETKTAEEDMIEEFCDRHLSTLAGKGPYEVISMWLDWQYSRFKVKEEDDFFIIFDFEKFEAAVIVNKELAHAKQEAYSIADMLNESVYQSEDYPKSEDFSDFLNYIMEKANNNSDDGDEDLS